MDTTLAEIEQPAYIIGLGRGMNGCAASELTRQRAVAAGNFYQLHHPKKVIFSGKGSTVAWNMLDIRPTEARSMDEIAALPDDVAVLEEDSTTTAENFLNCSKIIDSDDEVGVMGHGNHLPRALFLGNIIMTQHLVAIRVEDFGASPEPWKSVLLEKFIYFGTRIVYWGIGKGDVESFLRRDAKINSFRNVAKTVLRPILQTHDAYN